MRDNHVVSTGMDAYQAASLLPWYDILTDEFLISLKYDQFKDIKMSENYNFSKYLYDMFQQRMWLSTNRVGFLQNNGKLLEWRYDDTKMLYLSISKVIDENRKLILVELS
jgi:hypothetical protein